METTIDDKTLMLGINSIVVCRWGYSMILVDFYKVIRETVKTVLLQSIGSKEIGDGGFLTGTATPDENVIRKEQIRAYKIADEK
jgi:hypothetical protein